MKRLFMASLISIFILSACATNTPSTPTVAIPPTHPVPPTATLANPASPTNPTNPTVTATESSSSSGCTNTAAFVEDVTIPDYTHLDPRESFTKTWRIKNTGTCTWNTGYTAVYVSGDKLGPNSITFVGTGPGSTIDISAPMVAPNADGQFKIFYQLEDSAGNPITIDDGNTIWAIITVGKVVVNASPTPAPVSGTPNTTPGATGSGTTTCVSQANPGFISQTLDLINVARTTNGLTALALNSQLSSAAQAHSADMACSGILSHTGTDDSTPASRIAASGYAASITRENIYAQPPQYGGNPQSAMEWWMNSQIHRDAILNAQVTEIGIRYAYYSKSPLGGYFTLDFGAP